MKTNMLKALSLISVLSVLMSFAGLKKETFRIEIIQNGKPVEIKDNVVKLEKSEFQLRVSFKQKQDGIFMSASFNRDYYDTPENEEIKDYQWLNNKVRAEKNFNEDKELVIDDEIFSYLFYDPKSDWHRFDPDVVLKGKTCIGTKTIKNIHIEDADETYALHSVSKDVYMFFLATEKWANGNKPKELARIKFKITWR